jgi:coenzyme PQQ biosynthesis probable peptidase PqqF
MPATSPIPTDSALEPLRRRLDNGLGVALVSLPGASKAAISLRVAAGSHDEPQEYPGLAHFLEHLVFLGSAGFDGEQRLMPFVQACGGQVNATTQARHTDYFCEVPAQRLGEALARLVDMLARPLLEPAAQLREREVVHAEYLARSQDADTLVATALSQALAHGHRCAAFVAGNRHTLAVESAAFQHALMAFHRRFYQTAHLSLVLVGPQTADQLHDLAKRYGAVLPTGEHAAPGSTAPLLPLGTKRLRMTWPGPSARKAGANQQRVASKVASAALTFALLGSLIWSLWTM